MLSSNSIKEHTAFLWFLPINLQPLKFKGFKVGYPNGKCTLLNKIHMDKRVYISHFCILLSIGLSLVPLSDLRYSFNLFSSIAMRRLNGALLIHVNVI